jgi:(3,5-dihydroxyphenyl)acetyl-CoA 1,2-dioxygenase
MAWDALAAYDTLTGGGSRALRLDALCRLAAERFPAMLPGAAELAAEAALPQREKKGLEKAQGRFLATLLADPRAGTHLVHSMLLPRADAVKHLAEFEAKGVLELAGARLHRQGKAAILTLRNPRYLNAEDETTLDGFEIAADVALLDAKSELCVLRGDTVTHTKHAGKRVFGAGINLTHLYQGRIRYLWYLIRDLGVVNKLYRGLALPGAHPEADSREKPWVAAVENFAIGGHCQLVLTMDYVLAAADAYMTLPARKEGIIPGAANLRLPRFVGPRIARQAILAGRRLDCDSPEGRMICDEIVPAADMDQAIARTIALLTDSGVVSAAGNRRALRSGEEPLDAFRRYMAVYAREQADCHFSPALIANLEKHWNAANRRG